MIVAIIAIFVSFKMVDRIAVAHGKEKTYWIGTGSVILTIGIWAMHFIGMLSYETQIPVTYHLGLTALSLFIPLITALIVIIMRTKFKSDFLFRSLGIMLMGLAFMTMHILGMKSMEMAATVHYHRTLSGFSIFLAFLISWALFSSFSHVQKTNKNKLKTEIISSSFIGLGLAIVHYTAMMGIRLSEFSPTTENHRITLLHNSSMQISTNLLAYVMGLATIIIFITIIAFDSKALSDYKERVKKAESALMNTIRRQQGMTLKYVKRGDHYIHTLMEGQLLEKMGLTPAMEAGKNLHQFYSKQDADRIEQAYSKAWNGEISDYEAQLNGVDYFVTLSPVKQKGKVVEVIGSGVDITERKRTEQIHKESLALKSALINSLEIGMVVIDDDRKIIAINHRWCQLLQIDVPIAEMVGKDIFVLLHVYFQNHQQDKQIVNKILANRKPVVDEVNHFEKQIFKRSYFPFYIADELKGHIWAVEDITERRAMERGIIETKEEAVKANQAKSEFLSRMSHELRTPLNAILGFSQLLELEETLTAKQREFVDQIGKGGTHLLTLINDVLDSAAIEAGKLKMETEAISIGTVIDECVRFISLLAANKGVRILIEQTAPDDCYVVADRFRLQQVFLNLLDNAIKYNRENGTVGIHWDVKGDFLFVHIVDSGGGIPSSEHGQIFEPFYRSGHQQIEGTGIGLSLVRQLIQLMGGTVAVESRMGVGSDFCISLPLVKAPGASVLPQLEKKAPIQLEDNEFTILYIEDNLSNLQLIKEILGTIPGIGFLSAVTGAEGIELALVQRPDLILLDLNLPDLNGYEVFERIKANPACERTPIIALSANAIQADINRALAKGFTDYICKPIDIPVFLSVVANHLR
ncbi:ATP-binding protein [Neobacillus soli]|uniref:ATP-binding protein n=1 Tax=Neobacillus soli TaxID=220688 RepID=UPI000825D74B|nr:ATP-binding protein [Neobacillus soli]